MIAVYYPYYANASKWHELKYSLRSLEKNLKSDFEVFIVGDKPDWLKNVHHIAHIRGLVSREPTLFDTLSKLKIYIDSPDTPNKFIRMYDDVYLLRPIEVIDLEVVRYLYRGFKHLSKRTGIDSGSSIWREQVMRTLLCLAKEGYPDYMTETHCPEIFFKDKMKWVMDKFRALDNRLLVSTLYFNIFPYSKKVMDRKTQRILFYGSENDYSSISKNISAKCRNKYFLNHSDLGLNRSLMGYISNEFPKKSRFEK